MNFLDSALKSRKPEDKQVDAAPPSKAMPGEGEQSQPDPCMAIMDAIRANPELMARVQELVSMESQGGPVEEMAENEDPDMAAMDSEVAEGLSDHDKMDMKSRKPRSLGERAKLAALERTESKS